MRRIFATIIAGVFFLFFFSLSTRADELKIGGGAGPIDGFLKPLKEPFEKATGIKLTLNSYGGTIAFKLLEKGESDAAAVGLTFKDLMAELEKDKIIVPDPSLYQHSIIGSGKIYVIVNKDNPVTTLSRAQLKSILTGKTTSWQDVGGKNSIIMVVINKNNVGTNNTMMKIVLDGEPFLRDVLYVGSVGELKTTLAQNTEAIAFGPYALIDQNLKAIDTPEISRPIILITKGKPSSKVQMLIDFIKKEGNKYIKD
jgi:phosphate transport system substrate-binding protein